MRFPPTPPLDTSDFTADELRDARERDEYKARNARIIREAAATMTGQPPRQPDLMDATSLAQRAAAVAASYYASAPRPSRQHVDDALLGTFTPQIAADILAAEVCALRAELELERDNTFTIMGLQERIDDLTEQLDDLTEQLELERDNNTKVAEQNDQLELMLNTRPRDEALELELRECASVDKMKHAREWANGVGHRQYLVVGGGPGSLEAHFNHYEITELANILAARHMHLVSDATGIYACNNTEACE